MSMTTEDLMDLDDIAFKDLVDKVLRDNREADPELTKAMTRPDVVDRYFGHLQAIKKKIESDLARRQQECEAAVDNAVRIEGSGLTMSLEKARADADKLWDAYDRWVPGALRFLSTVETAIEQVRPLRDAALRSQIDPQTHRAVVDRVVLLEEGIRRHRESLEPGEASEADTTLWALVP